MEGWPEKQGLILNLVYAKLLSRDYHMYSQLQPGARIGSNLDEHDIDKAIHRVQAKAERMAQLCFC
jgi:hypothetical protein